MNLAVGPDLVLAFVLLFARAGGMTLGLPAVLGVALPLRFRVLLALLLAGALLPLAHVVAPAASGIGPIVVLVLRELGVGVMLAFAAALVVGAAVMAGDLCGAGMEFNSGGLLRGSVQMPNVMADSFGALAAFLFFFGGFHRTLILGLARSLAIAPLGRMTLPPAESLLAAGGRVFALALELALPLIIPLFVLALAQGVIARLAPQVNILVAAPAAVLLAGLILLGLDASGLAFGIMRAWTSLMTTASGWLDG